MSVAPRSRARVLGRDTPRKILTKEVRDDFGRAAGLLDAEPDHVADQQRQAFLVAMKVLTAPSPAKGLRAFRVGGG